MRRLLRTPLLTALAFVLVVPLAASAQTDALAADLEKDWLAQKARILALAEAMPEDKYSFKATEAQRTFGEQLAHLAQAHVKMLQNVDTGRTVPLPTLGEDHSKAATLKMLEAAYDYGAAVLKANASRLLDAQKGATPARTFWAAMGNAQNHYGQSVVYLRLNGIVPPASRR